MFISLQVRFETGPKSTRDLAGLQVPLPHLQERCKSFYLIDKKIVEKAVLGIRDVYH